MSDNTLTKQVQYVFPVRLICLALIGLAILAGCQLVATTPISITPTLPLPAVTETSTTIAPGTSTATWTPAPTAQAATLTPTVIPTAENAPIALIGTIIDGTGAEPIEEGVIIIQGRIITAVGPRQDVEIPSDANVIDLHGSTILPGFINAHIHNGYAPLLLEMWAQAGVTTVRDLGARYPFTLFPTRDLNNTDPNLATVLSAGPLITVPGGYPIVGSNFPSLAVVSPERAEQEVTQLIADGADVIKIVVDSGDGLPTLSLETASAIVETAHRLGVPVAAHIRNLRELELVLDAGIDDFSHIVPGRIPEDVLEQIVAENVYWIPTLETAGGYDAGNIRIFIDAGGQIALGNDSGMLPGMELGMPLREIEYLQAAGMTPMEIILAATRNAAHVCNRGDTLGTLEVGKIADILVINGDPLENLGALKDVRMVIHQGVIIRDSTRP